MSIASRLAKLEQHRPAARAAEIHATMAVVLGNPDVHAAACAYVDHTEAHGHDDRAEELAAAYVAEFQRHASTR